MRSAWFLPPLAACLFAASAVPLPAQEEKAKPPDPAMEAFTALQKEFRQRMRDAGVNENADRARAEAAKSFVPRFRSLADANVGTPAGLAAIRQVLRLSGTAKDAAGGADLEAEAMSYAEGYLKKAIETASNPEVKASAHVALGDLYWEEGEAKGERLAKARAAYEAAVKALPDSEVTKGAKGNLFEIDFLQVGKPAPDFEFPDLAGKTRKLSEFRGKVLLLNFWATW